MTTARVPTGTVTFLFTDIEGSTVRWEAHRDAMAAVLRRHDALLRRAIDAYAGYVFKTVGDAFCAAFARPSEALAAASDAQRALAAEDWSSVGGLRVRMALHTGTAEEREGDYFGPAVNRVARLLSTAHGGQIVVSEAGAQALRDEDPSTAAMLRDLGSHRLKDVSAPERVHQVVVDGLPAEFPPLLAAGAAAHNLPAQTTSFIGRDDDLARLREELGEARLVSLVGPGGVGKTRLAVELGAELVDRFPDGVRLIELAPVTDPELVVDATAHAVEARVMGSHAVPAAIVSTLRAKCALLIFDNCEHVVAEAAVLIDMILRGAPDVRVLATSRQPLELSGEHVHRVDPLAVPEVVPSPSRGEPGTLDGTGTRLPAPEADGISAGAAALASPAVRLFVDRAHATDPRFALSDANASLAVEVCRRLDGLALAIELAASRVGTLGLKGLAERLDERFRLLSRGNRAALPRQQTMRALFDWSYDLLEERERELFRRLAVFVGGWTVEAAAAVAVSGDEWDVMELLGSLVTKSLVVRQSGDDGESRFRFLESTRQYAADRLREADDLPASLERHARYYVDYVAKRRELSERMEDLRWQHEIRCELDNIRAALTWALVDEHDRHAGVVLLTALRRPRLVMLPKEAERWFDLALPAAERDPDLGLRASFLVRRAAIQQQAGCSVAIRTAAARAAVEAAEAANDPLVVAEANVIFAVALRDGGQTQSADVRFACAERALPETDRSWRRTELLTDWATNDLLRKAYVQASERFDLALQLARPGSALAAAVLTSLAELEFAGAHTPAALEHARRARDAFAQLGIPLNLAAVTSNIAAYEIDLGNYDEAVTSAEFALGIVGELDVPIHVAVVLEHLAVAGTLSGLGDAGARLLGYTEARYCEFGQARGAAELRGLERVRAKLEKTLPHGQLAALLGEGSRLTQDEAVRLGRTIAREVRSLSSTEGQRNNA